VTDPASTDGALVIFSDGACSGNPGPGGWATRLRYPDGRVHELGGAEEATTNNRMEIRAAMEGLKRAAAEGYEGPVVMVTDSQYLRKGITEWIHNWKRKGWVTAAKKPVLNQDLWRELDGLNHRAVEWRYTKGHAGDPDNERCDEIAHGFSQGRDVPLQQA
jgi:ribonuclease HI